MLRSWLRVHRAAGDRREQWPESNTVGAMKRIKILLLNLDSRNESGNELQEVLQAGAPDAFQIKHGS